MLYILLYYCGRCCDCDIINDDAVILQARYSAMNDAVNIRVYYE